MNVFNVKSLRFKRVNTFVFFNETNVLVDVCVYNSKCILYLSYINRENNQIKANETLAGVSIIMCLFIKSLDLSNKFQRRRRRILYTQYTHTVVYHKLQSINTIIKWKFKLYTLYKHINQLEQVNWKDLSFIVDLFSPSM